MVGPMRVFIQKLAGVHLGAQGEVAERGFRSLGIECHEFLADDDLEGLTRADLVLGNRLVLSKRLSDSCKCNTAKQRNSDQSFHDLKTLPFITINQY